MFIAVGQFLDCTAFDPKFDCSNIQVGERTFNLSSLNRTWTPSITEKVSQGEFNTTYYINICEALPYNDTSENTCEAGTNICAIKTIKFNNDDSDDDPKIIDIKQIVKNSADFPPSYSFSEVNDGSLEIILGGGKYEEEQQKANITFLIDQDKDYEPDIKEYKNNTLFIEWKIETSGIFIGFLGYLVIGIAYNHHTYNSHGWDLLPHRDFWRSVPYMLSDLSKNILNYISGHYRGYSQV
ncbi:autophagy-related protein 27-domain-containing protein [Gigaspora rosea]|uniref:Autophagy-related protein 27 n=1 Tax=Gigaspora rosea TaxID=44941 RepID=A0A397WAD0_9GLOM|nr:autophagy-related protein 27-domain-containing protein [Gigaspora rosea]